MSLDSGRSSAQPGSQISKSKGVLRWRNERTSAVATDSTRQIFRVMVVEQGRAGINQNKLRRTAAKGRRESTLCEGASRDDGYDARSRNPTGLRNAAFFDFGEMNSRRQESSRPPEHQESGQTQPNEWDAYSRHGPGYGAPSGRTGGSDVPSSSIVGRCDAANVTLGYTDVYFLCDWCDDGSRRRLKGVSRMMSWHEQSVKTL